MDENKKRALTAALAQIDKQFGKGTVMLMGDKNVEAAEVIGTAGLEKALDARLRDHGLAEAKHLAQFAAHSGRSSEVLVPDEGGRHRVVWTSMADYEAPARSRAAE